MGFSSSFQTLLLNEYGYEVMGGDTPEWTLGKYALVKSQAQPPPLVTLTRPIL